MLFDEQFGFQAGHWTDHALTEIVDRITYCRQDNMVSWEASILLVCLLTFQKHLTL